MILIDSREPENIQVALPLETGITCSVTALKTGDFMLIQGAKVMLVERKAAGDLLNSITKGSLVEQCSRLVEASQLPLLLTHGSLLCNKEGYVVADGRVTNHKWWSLQMQLVSLQSGGIMHLHTPKNRDLYDTLKYLHEWLGKPEHLLVNRRDPLPFLIDTDKKNPLKICASLPGIGMSKAAEILEWYSTAAYALMGLTQRGAEYPRGIAGKTVENVREALGLKDDESLIVEMK